VYTTEVDSAAWVAEHQVCWELFPVQELVKGHGLQQTGYALQMFGRCDRGANDDWAASARSIHERLRLLANDALEALPAHPMLQPAPAGRAVVRMESPIVVEVELTVIASPPDPAHPLPPAGVKRLIAALGDRLRSMGLKKRGGATCRPWRRTRDVVGRRRPAWLWIRDEASGRALRRQRVDP
jgi:hypothetical protein